MTEIAPALVPALLTVVQAAAAHGVSESTVRRGIREGRIPSVRLTAGGDLLVPHRWVLDLGGA